MHRWPSDAPNVLATPALTPTLNAAHGVMAVVLGLVLDSP
jgi:hypothetical protein